MIVDADFLDHWRTRMLVDALGEDEFAPLYVIRIWANCQNRKSTRFDAMPAAGLKALCRYKGEAAKLEQALIDAGFIVRDGNAIDVPKWAEHNAKLISNWTNGATGGRPPKTQLEPKNNPNETQYEPTETQAEPIREEEIRLDKTKEKSKTEATPRGTRLAKDWVAGPEFIAFCQTERPDLDPKFMQDKFRDFWTGVPGKGGLKLDWLGTWRNFIRSERAHPARASPASTAGNAKLGKAGQATALNAQRWLEEQDAAV